MHKTYTYCSLFSGNKTVSINGDAWDYEGEINEDGLACGQGVATRDKAKFTGTFFNDKLEGICK